MMIWQDCKYALRLLSKKPGFTALTTLVMATGIGLSVYMFSFFNTVLFKELPFKDGHSLVMLSTSQNGQRNTRPINLHDYLEISNSIKGLSELGGYRNESVIVAGRDGARRFSAIYAQSNIFQLTRTKPVLGRGFTLAENKAGAEKVVVISFELWQNQFAGEQQVVSQTLQVNGQSHRIIGVMEQGYRFPNKAQMWLPLRENATGLARGKSGDIHGLAHLDEGSSIADIDRQLNVIMARISAKHPATNSGVSAYVTSIPGSGTRGGKAVVYSMHIVAVLILVLASINVANLLLSRAVERGKETAIRVALGAPRSRLISQMLWESIIICSLGGIIGLLVMAWGLQITGSIVATFFADPAPFWWTFGLDSYTIKLFLAIVVGTILVTGLLPAWKNSGGDFNAVLRDGTRGALGKKAGRLNRILVISEIFISMAVLIAAAVMVLAAYMQSHKDIGVDTKNTLVAKVLLTELNYASAQKKVQFAKTLQSRLENSTGIKDVMLASALPGHYSSTPLIAIEGKEYAKNNNTSYPRANYIAIMPGALAKLGVELRQGRYFNSSDDGLNVHSALVSESFAKRHFPDQSPIGKRFRLIETDTNKMLWTSIVGVVEQTVQGSREKSEFPSIYRPYTQAPRNQLSIAMQMKSSAAVATKSLRKILQSIDPNLPSFTIETYSKSNQRITAPISFISNLSALFALAAVVLAASGIFGVMSNSINQRIQEIGIKRALGADEQLITREFLMAGLKLLLWGGLPGILVGSSIGFAMSQVFGTGNAALSVIAIAMTILIGSVVMFSTYLPTQRALKMEPSDALHYE
jgi:putative ABC transport system permease protein